MEGTKPDPMADPELTSAEPETDLEPLTTVPMTATRDSEGRNGQTVAAAAYATGT